MLRGAHYYEWAPGSRTATSDRQKGAGAGEKVSLGSSSQASKQKLFQGWKFKQQQAPPVASQEPLLQRLESTLAGASAAEVRAARTEASRDGTGIGAWQLVGSNE